MRKKEYDVNKEIAKALIIGSAIGLIIAIELPQIIRYLGD